MQEGCITERMVRGCSSQPIVTEEYSNHGGALFGPWNVLKKTQHMQEGCITERMVAKCFTGPKQTGGAVLIQY